ncbi:uncharacterized protein LY89DRAFT_787708 [Mollisia scopiformis]|uniref:Uncharacterized protein n=1 Tax=Mollisia scopiformis TaxID=149040 RepID=A0A132BCF8_MOLSC|nr:uncharacterized protein LY89DRAFT_787708 [Mollisia scopiformis]KUJ10058.1 hypothetical protein LY89DRAFT_787708 [Mollisia scopiformis]
MPPKGARGGAARGRGRGRGKATAPAAPSAMEGLIGESANEPSSQSTLEDSSLPSAKITTPQHLLDDNSVPSPNSSPVSIPTETPAPTPARAPIPRSEPTVSSSSHVGEPSTRGGRGGARGAKPAAASRFKPKNVRSDASKLKEIAEREEAKLHQLAVEKAREQARLLRGRGRLARGRGDVMGRRVATASGIFSIAPEALKSNPEFASKFKSGGGGGGSSSGVKKEVGASSRAGGPGGSRGGESRSQDYEPRYPDQDEDTPRIDIETINISSDDEEPVFAGFRPALNGKAKAGSSKGGLKPVRLHREEHKERVTLVNTEPTTKPPPEDDDEELPTIDELRSAKATRINEPSSPKATFIKYEVDDGDMQMSFRSGKPPPSASPDAKRKLQESNAFIPPIELDTIPEGSAEANAKAKKEQKQRTATKKADKKPVLQTAQDKAEYERHLQDVAILADELGGLQGNLRDIGKGKDVEGDVEMGGTLAEDDKKSGRLYLFQFPPVLPELYNPIHGKPKSPAEVKAEELAKAEEEKKAAEAAAKAEAKGKSKSKAADTNTDAVEIKVETTPALSPEDRKKKEEEEKRKKRQGFVKEQGYIGKLIVRESGRVELSWGGTSLLVGRGVDAGFLTTGVVVDSQERGPPGGGVPEGQAMSMGQIMGKFVVTPDWQKMA